MRLTYIELLGEQHPLCFSLAATEALVDAFGSLEGMQDALTDKNLSNVVRSIDTALTILLKSGRLYAGAMGEKLPRELPGRPVDFIDVSNNNAVRAIFAAMKSDTTQTIQATAKNAGATQGEETLRGCITTEPGQD